MRGRHFSRAVLGGAGAEVLLAAFKSILGHEGLVCLSQQMRFLPKPNHIFMLPALYQLCPGTCQQAPLHPISDTSLAGSAPPLPKQSCPHSSYWPPCTCAAPGTHASKFLFLTPSGCLKCSCPRDKIQCAMHSQGAAVIKFCRSKQNPEGPRQQIKRTRCADWFKWMILASLSAHIFTFLNFLPSPQMFCYI